MRKRNVEWVLRHKPLIFRESFRAWAMLTASEKAWIDVEDLYAEALVKVLAQESHYDSSRGAESTFVVMVAARALRDYTQKFTRIRRKHVTVSLTDWQQVDGTSHTNELMKAVKTECKFFDETGSETRVMEFFRLASKEAARYVLYVLKFGRKPKKWKSETMTEIKWALERSGAVAGDFIICRAALV